MTEKRKVQKGWMLRTSPHNEDFVLAVALSAQDLIKIANQYVLDVGFGKPEILASEVDWPAKTVTTTYGPEDDPDEKVFYISEVDVLV